MKISKFFFPIVLATLLLGLTQCDSIKNIEQNVNGRAVTFDLPPQAAGDYMVTQEISFNFDSLVSQFDLDLINLAGVKPQSATISIIDTSATPVTFDILDNVELYLESATIPARKIAYKDPVLHTGLITLALDVDNTNDILDFANANTVTIKLKAKLNAATDHQIQMKVAVQWHIAAEL